MNKPKLSDNEKHLIRLLGRDEKKNGYVSVSAQVWPFTSKLPPELVESIEVGTGGIARLTKEGETVLKWLL